MNIFENSLEPVRRIRRKVHESQQTGGVPAQQPDFNHEPLSSPADPKKYAGDLGVPHRARVHRLSAQLAPVSSVFSRERVPGGVTPLTRPWNSLA